MVDGRLISAFMPGAITAASLTGLSGIFACWTLLSGIVTPAITIFRGGGEVHSRSLQETASPSTVASLRDKVRSGLPLSIHTRMRSVDPSARGTSALITTRL